MITPETNTGRAKLVYRFIVDHPELSISPEWTWKEITRSIYDCYVDAGSRIIPRGRFGFICDVDPNDSQVAWLCASRLAQGE